MDKEVKEPTKVVSVLFKESIYHNNRYVYDYYTNIQDLQEGDYVVVQTKYGPAIAVVKGYKFDNKSKYPHLKWVISKVNKDFTGEE